VDWTAFGLSLRLALWTCVLLVPAALVLARWLAWSPSRARPFVEAALMLPLVLPPTVLGYYLLVGLAPTSLAGRVLGGLAGQPLVFTFPGILLALLIVNLPFAVQPMQCAFEGVAPDLREAAWVSGLSR
jgi:molybdate transport system permease protein